jgi:hypothetical protein
MLETTIIVLVCVLYVLCSIPCMGLVYYLCDSFVSKKINNEYIDIDVV